MFFTEGKTVWIGECSDSQALEDSSQGVWDKSRFYRMLEKAPWKQGMIG